MTGSITTLVITRGLPASGKTTWAMQWVKAEVNRVRVNRDDLRASLFGGEGLLPRAMEDEVTTAQGALVRTFLRKGVSVVVDDTNLNAKTAKRWKSVAEQCGAAFRTVDFLTPVEECILRDKKRGETMTPGRSVGQVVIAGFYDRYMGQPLPDLGTTEGYEFTTYVPDDTKPDAWICDLDGTLAIKGDRDIYDASKVYLDTVNVPVAEILWGLANAGYSVLYTTGRDAVFYEVTNRWLIDNDLPFGELLMRAKGDRRDDAIVKHEILMRDIAPHYCVVGALDDRDRVVDMWRRVGIPCMQVNYGNF